MAAQGTGGRARGVRAVLWAAYAALAAFVYAGFLVCTSDHPVIGPYSVAYVGFLAGVLALLGTPVYVALAVRRFGARRLLFAATPSAALLAAIYLVASTKYYWTRTHDFDPYLQNHVPRVAAGAMAKPPGTLRVLALGGSTTKNSGLREGRPYPEQLQELLAAALPDRPVEVFNAGQDWYTTKHSLINYVTYMHDWQPDVVVVMHAINDLVRSFSPPEYALYDYDPLWMHYFASAMDGARPPAYPQLLARRYLRLVGYKWYTPYRGRARAYPLSAYRSLPQYEQHLRELARYVRSDGVALVFVTQPYLYKRDMPRAERNTLWFGRRLCRTRTGFGRYEYPSAASLADAMAAYVETTRRVAAETGVPCIDAEAQMPKTLEVHRDDVHYTGAGAERLARIVADGLLARGLPAPAATPAAVGPAAPVD